MKKLLLSLLLFIPAMSYAQLSVGSNGSVIAGSKLFNNSTWGIGLQSGITTNSNSNAKVGIYGRVDSYTNSNFSYGVMGVACNTSGMCGFGVTGCLADDSMNGAGIFGSTCHEGYMGITGRYAGFFKGNTKVNGTLTATSVVQQSDVRLKENIIPLGDRSGSILDKVLNMNVVEYNYKKMLPSFIIPDSLSVEDVMKEAGINPDKRHIGLIAQELKELFPTLVEEGQDGYLTVNYVELVPVLISAIQELKQELDAVKRGGVTKKTATATPVGAINTSNDNNLFQNTPNPFKEQTVIRFHLADNAQNASICIFDMTGKQLQKIPISPADESVVIPGYELGEGLYLYSLVVNGQEIDTKKMIISK